ncbi:MAG: glycosyltransferase [Actinomycetia bacterium]|nr:glycosyltransferase [Actinomycetes bacterium]
MKAAVHVGQLLQPVPGGIGRYVRNLVGALPAAGVEVQAFAAGPAPDGIGSYTDLGQPTGPIRYEAWHRFRRPVVKVPGDLVHATSLAVTPAGKRPLVVTVHDLVFLRQPEHLTSRGVSFHRRGLAIARREAAGVIVPTEFGRADLVREGFDPERVHVAHHGVEQPVAPDPAVVGAVLEWLGVRSPFLLFVGTIEPRKGVGDVLDAHAALRARRRDLGLVLAGPPGWGEAPDLDRPGVVATGNIGDRELDVLYRSATALVLPERYSGFGLPVVEAMARGCPVVTSDAACLPEVVGEGGITTPVGDVGALADALAAIVDDPAHRADLAARARVRAEDFTWERSARAHRLAYEAALER